MKEDPLVPLPVEIKIAGRVCRLSYPMRAVIQYQAETARIERNRPRLEDPDPRCLCGARKSQHRGPTLIRLGEDDALLCPRFRVEDRLLGDSLFTPESWLKIDLNIDPERWLVCLWCGMHEQQPDGKWIPPFTLAELETKLGLSADTRQFNDPMFEAMTSWMPKAKKIPNEAAPGEPAQSEAKSVPTSPNSKPMPNADSGLVGPNS